MEITTQNIKLISPDHRHKKEVNDYKAEFELNNESMDGTANLRNSETYEIWLDAIKDNQKEETVREGLVPASTFLAIRISDSKLIGMIDIRHRLNDYLIQFGGHIGYSVRKSERRKGYAKEMLAQGITKCDELSIKDILITCDKENIASSKTILCNGGILENEIIEGEGITQRYWIKRN